MKRRAGFERLAPDLGRRAATDRQEKMAGRNSMQEHNELERWIFYNGGFGRLANSEKGREAILHSEAVVANHIRNLLRKRQATGITKPVVAVDFGGMFGLSMAKTASMLQTEIQNSTVALVVTSLQFDLDEGLRLVKDGKVNYIRDNFGPGDIELIEQHKSLVHYVRSDAAELRDQVITLPDGSNLPLDGNIDFLHERMALTNSRKADVDLPLLARRMSKDGIMFIGSQPSNSRTDEFGDRSERLAMGLHNVEDLNFRTVPSDTQYQVLAQPGADLSLFI